VPTKTPVTLIPGDGIGPECVDAARRIIEAAGVPLEWEIAEAGAEVFKKGLPSGVPAETMDSIARTRVALKGPLETPSGSGRRVRTSRSASSTRPTRTCARCARCPALQPRTAGEASTW